jgi:hypothetical protein
MVGITELCDKITFLHNILHLKIASFVILFLLHNKQNKKTLSYNSLDEHDSQLFELVRYYYKKEIWVGHIMLSDLEWEIVNMFKKTRSDTKVHKRWGSLDFVA